MTGRACKFVVLQALIRGHLGTSWPCHAVRLSVGLPEMQCRFLRGPSMAAVIARITRLGAESTGRDGSRRLKHWCQAPQGRAANLVVSALRESSVFWIHCSDLCGLQRRESLGFAGIEAESEHGPGRPLRLRSAFSLGKPSANVVLCPRSVGTS